MRLLAYFCIALLLVLGITFSCLNAEPVTVNYYVAKTTLPLSLMLVACLMLGALMAGILAFFVNVKYRLKLSKLAKRVKLAEEELNNLRTIPVKESR